MSHHIVEVQDLTHTYGDGTRAVNGISFHIHHGESVAVVGANGAGKSTLLLHLNGYLTPQQGKVRIGDFYLTKETVKEIRKTVGMIFQNPDDQLFMPTVYDDVAFGPINLGLSPILYSRRPRNSSCASSVRTDFLSRSSALAASSTLGSRIGLSRGYTVTSPRQGNCIVFSRSPNGKLDCTAHVLNIYLPRRLKLAS